jgi:hypothetical protein
VNLAVLRESGHSVPGAPADCSVRQSLRRSRTSAATCRSFGIRGSRSVKMPPNAIRAGTKKGTGGRAPAALLDPPPSGRDENLDVLANLGIGRRGELQPSDLSVLLLIVSPTGAVASCSSGDDRKASRPPPVRGPR